MTAYAIVVNVPELRNVPHITDPCKICFIATPFDGAFTEVSELIKNAANRLGMQGIRTDEVPIGANFVEDIINLIRVARLVVAVCSPQTTEGGGWRLNPNVLYELGLAQALGKPTLIMTDDMDTLPRDIDTLYAMPYSDAEVEQQANLLSRLMNEMNQRVGRMVDPLTDPVWHEKGISVAHAKHRMLVYPDFWEKFKTILTFSKKVHEYIQAVMTNHVDKLFRTAEDFAGGVVVGRKEVIDFNRAWRDYVRTYDTWTFNNLFEPLPNAQQEVGGCLTFLHNKVGPVPAEGDNLVERVRVCQKNYDIIVKTLTSYRGIHETLVDRYRGDFSIIENPQRANDVYMLLGQLYESANVVLVHADGLIKNLIELIAE